MKKTRWLIVISTLMLAFGLAFSACGPTDKPGLDKDDEPDPVIVTPTVSVSPQTLTLDLGGVQTLAATTTPAGTAVVWSSVNPAVASVENGAVTGVSEGLTSIKATITVDGKSYEATCAVKVNGPKWALALSKNALVLDINEASEAVTVVTADAGTVTWKSEDESVATVANGVVTGKKNGNTFIVVTGAKAYAKISVSVRGDGYLGAGAWTAITNKADFLAINYSADARYYLTQDIDFGGDTIQPIGTPTPTGSATMPANNFGGILEGNGFAVKNFKIAYPTALGVPVAQTTPTGEPNPEYANAHDGKSFGTFGLFVQVKAGAVIRNLNVIDFSVEGHMFVAGIAGANSGTIENCYVSGKVTNWQYFAPDNYDCPGGEIVGINNATGKIKNCVSYALPNDGHDGFGNARTFAISAWNWGEISNCFAINDNLEIADALSIAAAVQTGPPPMIEPIASEGFTISDGAKLDRYDKLLGAEWVFEDGKLPYLNSPLGPRAWIAIF